MTNGVPIKTGIEEALRRIVATKALHVEELDLGGLGLTEVPMELMELPWLKRLFLGPDKETRETWGQHKRKLNALTNLPPKVFLALPSLRLLDLSGNKLSALPAEIDALAALQSLNLSSNQLSALPPEIGALTALQSLDLSSNQLSALPPEIGALTAVRWLNLSSHQLSALPAEIGALTALQHLFLGENPLVTPPPEVVKKGLEAIRAYLRELGRTGEPLFEAKIVLVGEGAVGKTTLKERLIRGRFATPGSTRGLETEAVPRAHPMRPGKTMTLNFWDFGGQEDYRPAQQFFFSKGALYILVWHAREDVTRSNAESWMRLIRHRVGPGARVLVVATHADAHPPGDGVRQLCADKFPGMAVGFYSVDNKSGKGATELWQAIEREVVQLEEFGAERPKSWIDARDAILAKHEGALANQMPFVDFRKLAIDKGVAEDAVETFAAMLTSQGRIVYHGDDPHLAGTVVLDPEWLMKAIAYVLTDTETKDANGILPETSLARIWLNHARAQAENPIRYEKEHWNHLLRMMDRHDIVYRLREHEWLVGQLVSLTKPGDLPWDGRSALGNGAPLVTECRLDDQIPGLMALLTVRTHFYHYNFKRFCWREGVFLRDPNHTDTLALIEADGPQKLRISTVGTFSQSLMERLAGSLEQLIHEMWPGGAAAEAKPYAFIVPCPTEGCPGYYLRDDLFRDLADGDDTSRCNEGRRCKHDIQELLTGQSSPLVAFGLEKFGRRFDRIEEALAGVDGKLDDLRVGVGDMLSYVSIEAPRIYSLRPVEAKTWDPRRLIGQRIEIQVWCEELCRPVPGAIEVVKLDKAWVKHLRDWSPLARRFVTLGAALASGPIGGAVLTANAVIDLKALKDGTNSVLDAADHAIGDGKGNFARGYDRDRPIALQRGQFVDPNVAAVLCKAAKNGGMTRIQMDDDKRWRWVCKEVADRNDRSVPKE